MDLNACGLAQSNFIYCVARDSNEGEINPGQLVRVTCPLPTQEGPGVGSVCYLGLVQGRPFSGTTDTRVDSMLTLNGNVLFNYSNIDSLVANGIGWNFQNQSTENLPRTSENTNVPSNTNIADPSSFSERFFMLQSLVFGAVGAAHNARTQDFVVLPDTTFEGDTGDWFVGCGRQNLPNNEERALVYVQLLGSNPIVSYDLFLCSQQRLVSARYYCDIRISQKVKLVKTRNSSLPEPSILNLACPVYPWFSLWYFQCTQQTSI